MFRQASSWGNLEKAMVRRILFTVCLGMLLAVLLGPVQLGTPVYAEEAEAECWSVIVGVPAQRLADKCLIDAEGNAYPLGVKYPDDSARDLYQELVSVWGKDHIKLLLNEEATKGGIYYAIKWLADVSDTDDTVLFYFSGHGYLPPYGHLSDLPIAEYVPRNNTPVYLCTYDCVFFERSFFSDTQLRYAISDTDLDSWLDMVDSEKVIIILETCFAGSFGKKLGNDGRVVLMSCQPDESSFEDPELKHGVFGHYILQAISNFEAADTNGDYEVSAEEIFDYAEPRTVDEIVRPYANEPAIEGRQHPVLYDPHYWRELSLLMRVVFHADGHLPPDTTVLTLDQKPYQSGELPASFTWAPGSVHDVDVPSKVDTEKGTRLVFVSWDDGDASVSRAISHGGEYVANYKTQYQLTIESAHGCPKGKGWYDSGSAATISVIPAEGTIVRQVFTGWSGDFTGTTAVESLVMDAPKAIKADWRTDYSRLYILVADIMVFVGAPVAGITYVQRRRKAS